eukprot:10955070-Karenia_brevis.AAC.1
MKNLQAKAQEYVEASHMTQEQARVVIEHLAAERAVSGEVNEVAVDRQSAGDADGGGSAAPAPLTRRQLEAKLEEMEGNMRSGKIQGTTDQWRVYDHIVRHLEHGPYLRLMVQAPAGTGKSYLLKA